MQTKTITIGRFTLTKMTVADTEKYFRLSNNAMVMKYVTGHPLTRSESDRMLKDITGEHDISSRFGRYFIEETATSMLVGAAKLDLVGSEVEIGYRIQQDHWGKGIATEIARGLIDFAQNSFSPTAVIAFVNIENHASVRVLEKVGMVNVETIEELDEVKYKFQLFTEIDETYNHKRQVMVLVILLIFIAIGLIFFAWVS